MTATDELRRLLDGRGVEWTYGDGTVSYASDGRWFHAWAYNDDTMCVSMGYLTPAQAVEATLGRGTCEMEYVPDWMGWHCKSCDNLRQGLRDQKPHYCPNCGRSVKA